MHPIVLFEMTNIFHAAGGKIVHQQDLVAAREQAFGNVRTDKTSTTSN
jgi:hypothetical protein